MIDLYYWPTPNGWKISIMLEECSLPYTLKPVNIGRGEQFSPAFLRLSPNNRMPAIVDHDPPGGGDPVAIFESAAILQYLAEKAGRFLPRDVRGRHEVLQWVALQVANLGAARRRRAEGGGGGEVGGRGDAGRHDPAARAVPQPAAGRELREAAEACPGETPHRLLAPRQGEAGRRRLPPAEGRHRAPHVHR